MRFAFFILSRYFNEKFRRLKSKKPSQPDYINIIIISCQARVSAAMLTRLIVKGWFK